MALREMKDICGYLLGKKPHAIHDLDVSLRAKGNVNQVEDTTLRACMIFANAGSTLFSTTSTLATWFAIGQANKFVGGPPVPRFLKFGICAGTGLLTGKLTYYVCLHTCAIYVLGHEEERCERMKMELASIILNKHSDNKPLVEAVKKQLFAEHLYSDQHQDRPLFRWRQRHSYVDSTYVERMKEIEASISEGAKTISGQTMLHRSFGDLMEDPLACILGSQDCEMESDKPPEHAPNILRRKDLRAQRRRHRHHHRHATV